MFDLVRIFQFLDDNAQAGIKGCLVTVIRVTGASVRNVGAHMAVSESGEFVGSLSGGCIEKAIVSEALEAIAHGKPRQIAYGAGSPFIDIRLPCGGRVELLLNPITDPAIAKTLRFNAEAREEWTLSLPREVGEIEVLNDGSTGCRESRFQVREKPALRLLIAGHGASVEALVRLAIAMEIVCEVFSPDPEIVARLNQSDSAETTLLEHLTDPLPQQPDAFTACVFLFHDHDWELKLIPQVLASPAFYIGAMGSLKTHTARSEALRESGVAPEKIGRIDAPIGLIPSSRDPETLALSILAEVVDRYNQFIVT